MAGAKFMVMYPRPQDTDTFEHLYQDEDVPIGDGLSSEYFGTFVAFEKLYQEEHVPMILDKLVGKTRFVATRVVGTLGRGRRSIVSPRSIFPRSGPCRRVQSPLVARRPWPMPSRSPVEAPRCFWSQKSRRLLLAAVPCWNA